MTFSYTQISQYLSCPRRYRYRYLDGWQEKDTRAAMLFGRAFETALQAHFLRRSPERALAEAWGAFRGRALEYGAGESWEALLQQGLELLARFTSQRRIRVRQPSRNLQVQVRRPLGTGDEFVSYIDALGELDGRRCLIEWKTTRSRCSEEPPGLLALDPQLVCYSWVTGIEGVALVVFVRKRQPEVQYLRASITEAQRNEFEQLVLETVSQIKAGSFPPHSGIRFPQNPCLMCPFVGLCLGNPQLASSALLRQPGAELDWINELCD